MNHADAARHIIASNRYLTMATAAGGDPWIAPLAYVVDSDYFFYYYSAVDSRHSQDAARNPTAAVAIFNSTESSDSVDGLQFSATVEEVDPSDLNRVMDLYFKQSFPDPADRARWLRPKEDFLGTSIQRFYRIKPLQIFKIDPASTKVDRRVEVDLAQLKARPAYPKDDVR